MRSALRFLIVFIIALLIGGIFIPGCGDDTTSSGSNNHSAPANNTTVVVVTNNTTWVVVTNNNTSCANYMEACNPTVAGGRHCCTGRYCEYSLGDGKTNGKCL